MRQTRDSRAVGAALASVASLLARPDLRVLVIWEPVLETGWGTPSQTLTGDVADPRVEHFRDPDRGLSAIYGGAPKLPDLAGVEEIGFRMKDVVWDTALLYPPGVKWGQPANLLVTPVVEFQAELAAALR